MANFSMTHANSGVRSRMPRGAGDAAFPHVGECRQRNDLRGGVVKDNDGGRVSAGGKAT